MNHDFDFAVHELTIEQVEHLSNFSMFKRQVFLDQLKWQRTSDHVCDKCEAIADQLGIYLKEDRPWEA
jgi:hypothetical protein